MRDPGLSVRTAVLGLGSNLGDSFAILNGAVADLEAAEGIEIIAASPLYATDPVGGPQQDPYLNAVLIARTSLDDHQLLAATQAVEQNWHRMRDVRWGPRTLDVDILAIDDEQSDDPDITVPHPRAHERAFVLVPWLAVDPEAAIAGRGRVEELLVGMDITGVRVTGSGLALVRDRSARA